MLVVVSVFDCFPGLFLINYLRDWQINAKVVVTKVKVLDVEVPKDVIVFIDPNSVHGVIKIFVHRLSPFSVVSMCLSFLVPLQVLLGLSDQKFDLIFG